MVTRSELGEKAYGLAYSRCGETSQLLRLSSCWLIKMTENKVCSLNRCLERTDLVNRVTCTLAAESSKRLFPLHKKEARAQTSWSDFCILGRCDVTNQGRLLGLARKGLRAVR